MTHKGTITLETERLILRRFIPSDLEPMFHNVWSNYNVWKWTNYEPMNSIDDVLKLNNIFTDKWFSKYEHPDYREGIRHAGILCQNMRRKCVADYFGSHQRKD